MISEVRKVWISELAESVASRIFSSTEPIVPEVIAKAYKIGYCYGEYGDYFDGMLEHSDGEFHVFINTTRHNNINRHRFTFAHELGHYFLDEHAIALAQGLSAGHCSVTGFISDSLVELEADLFAASLLMLENRVRSNYRNNKKFSFKAVESISKSFQVSLVSSLYRAFYLDLHPMMIIKIQNGRIVGNLLRSKDFYYGLRHKALPSDSGAFNYFKNGKEIKSQVLYAFDWFNTESSKNLFEYNLNINSMNLVYTILWTD